MIKKAWTNFCVLSMFLLTSTGALADLILAEGGASGQWFNPSRDGEGIFLEIIDTNSGPQVGIAWFTYDKNGNQMWLSGAVPVSGSAAFANIAVIVTSGPVFGSGYDPADLEIESWGDLKVGFSDCGNGYLTYTSSTGFGSGTIPLTRLTSLIQVDCDEPVDPEPQPIITPGAWRGTGVCFNVSSDGKSITEVNSECPGNNALDVDASGETPAGENCTAKIKCHGTFPIVNGLVSCFSEADNESSTIAFSSGTQATGTSQESEAFDSVCTASWSATPE